MINIKVTKLAFFLILLLTGGDLDAAPRVIDNPTITVTTDIVIDKPYSRDKKTV
jgi:hypothetical protein